jgi:hypothetical protein
MRRLRNGIAAGPQRPSELVERRGLKAAVEP